MATCTMLLGAALLVTTGYAADASAVYLPVWRYALPWFMFVGSLVVVLSSLFRVRPRLRDVAIWLTAAALALVAVTGLVSVVIDVA